MKLSRNLCKYAVFEFSLLTLVWISMFAFFNRFARQIVLKSAESCFALHLFIGRVDPAFFCSGYIELFTL